jgi:hypothetical protein
MAEQVSLVVEMVNRFFPEGTQTERGSDALHLAG